MLCEGVKKDLGRDYFATWFLEISLIEHEINHAIKHIEKWT